MIGAFTENPLAQTFGLLAMIVAFVGLLQKDDRNTVKIIMIASSFWIVHFYLMGLYSTMIVQSIGIVRLFLSLRYKRNVKVFIGVIIALLIVGITSFESKLSLLPIIGSCFTAYGYFFCEKLRLRIFIFISSIFWLTFNLNIGSVGGIINEIVSQLILIFMMYTLIRENSEGISLWEKIASIFKKSLPDADRYFPLLDYLRNFKFTFKNKIKRFFKRIW